MDSMPVALSLRRFAAIATRTVWPRMHRTESDRYDGALREPQPFRLYTTEIVSVSYTLRRPERNVLTNRDIMTGLLTVHVALSLTTDSNWQS